jgi:hypothetical protein
VLYCFDGATDLPTWQAVLPDDPVAVAVTDAHTLVLLSSGVLVAYTDAGVEAWRHSVSGRALATAPDGRWAVVGAECVHVGRGDAPEGSHAVLGGVAAAFGDDDLGVVTAARALSVVAADGTVIELDYGGDADADAVAWSPRRLWLVSQGDCVRYVDPDDSTCGRAARYEGSVVSGVVARGPMFAFRVDNDFVAVCAFPDGTDLCKLQYIDRTIGGIALAGEDRLAVAVGGGHANLVDLPTGALRRTDEHEGQERDRWMVRIQAETDWWNPPAEPEDEATGTSLGGWAVRVFLAVVALGFLLTCSGVALRLLFWLR